MEQKLTGSSVVEILDALQSAVDNGLNNGRFMLQNYRLKYRVDRFNKVVEFTVYRPMMREYRIKGEITRLTDNSYNITASISQIELTFTLIAGIFITVIGTGIIFRGGYIFGTATLVFLVISIWSHYKYTENRIKRIFQQLELNASETSSAKCEDCEFGRFIETGQGRWTYFKRSELIKRTRNMIIIDSVAVVCILAGFACFFYFVPILASIAKDAVLSKTEYIRLFSAIGIFLLCVSFITLSIFSGHKRK